MEIKMNLLENSEDYLEQSIELAVMADEFGNHGKDKTNKYLKAKWKLAFICMVQSLEVLCKSILYEINEKLIYKDIDIEPNIFSDTINLLVAVNRIMSFTELSFDKSETKLINKSIRLRNSFVHNSVKLYTEELKVLYCRLLKLYTKIYLYCIDIEFFVSKNSNRGYASFMHFTEYLAPFRGDEIRKDELDGVLKGIQENQKYHFYIKEGIRYKRVKYGDEVLRFSDIFKKYEGSNVYDYEYCGDCSAVKGEYHGELCDLEICPRCKGQRLSCNCFDKYHY